MMYYIKSKIRCSGLLGFSITEVIVTLAIFGVLSVTIYSSYPKVNNIFAYNETVNELMSDIKSAQIYGASEGSSPYRGSGLYFETDSSNNIKNRYIIKFLDKSTGVSALGVEKSNRYFDESGAGADLVVSASNLKSNAYIDRLCIKNTLGAIDCSKTYLSVTYVKPGTNANITDMSEALGVKNFFDVGYVELNTRNITDNNSLRCIEIYKNGQINLRSGTCL